MTERGLKLGDLKTNGRLEVLFSNGRRNSLFVYCLFLYCLTVRPKLLKANQNLIIKSKFFKAFVITVSLQATQNKLILILTPSKVVLEQTQTRL